MTLRRPPTTWLLLLALASAARADEVTVSGRLAADPLRIETARRSFLLSCPADLATALAAAAPGAPVVRARVDTSLRPSDALTQVPARLIGIEARSVADAALLDSPGLGGTRVGALRADAPVRVTGARRASGAPGDVDWVSILHEGTTRWVPGHQVRLGDRGLGRLVGHLAAPVFGAISDARDARTFHPDAVTYRGVVRPLAAPAPYDALARRLEGSALVRMGPGLWKKGNPVGEYLPDLLSMAIRISAPGAPPSTQVRPGDQDILVSAGAERFRSFAVAPFTQELFDYFANDYHPAVPFLVQGTGKEVWLRLVPTRRAGARPTTHAGREADLEAAARAGTARFRLELQERPAGLAARFLGWEPGVPPRRVRVPWIPVAELSLEAPVAIDQEALRYHPDMGGRGLTPTGFIEAIRGPVYRASSDARPGTAAERGSSRGITDVLRRP